MNTKTKILDSVGISQKINRLAWEVYENNLLEKEIIIVGISGRGEVLATLLSKVLVDISSIKITLGRISLDKDNPYDSDLVFNLTETDIENKVVILVDDVLNSGKTLMYAASEFLTVPLIKLSTVVLVNRNHNRYPIKSDYEGMSLSTTLKEHINVVFGKEEGVYLS